MSSRDPRRLAAYRATAPEHCKSVWYEAVGAVTGEARSCVRNWHTRLGLPPKVKPRTKCRRCDTPFKTIVRRSPDGPVLDTNHCVHGFCIDCMEVEGREAANY